MHERERESRAHHFGGRRFAERVRRKSRAALSKLIANVSGERRREKERDREQHLESALVAPGHRPLAWLRRSCTPRFGALEHVPPEPPRFFPIVDTRRRTRNACVRRPETPRGSSPTATLSRLGDIWILILIYRTDLGDLSVALLRYARNIRTTKFFAPRVES